MIWLTEPANLSEGLYWARRMKGDLKDGRGPWMIVCVVGATPFLDAYVIAYRPEPADPDEPWRMGYARSHKYEDKFLASGCEFGPRIDVPSDKERAELAPVAERIPA